MKAVLSECGLFNFTDMIRIENALPTQAAIIATLIMEAMNHECCQYFAGPRHTTADFHRLMKSLVERTDSQYSYTNTLVALDGTEVVGCCVSYDGARLHRLRQAFIAGVQAAFGMDHSGMDDETRAGELYIDSLAVAASHRGQGIATSLLEATCRKARRMNLPAGLLVDQGNPADERLYSRLGFEYVNDAEWGSHPMRHLQRKV